MGFDDGGTNAALYTDGRSIMSLDREVAFDKLNWSRPSFSLLTAFGYIRALPREDWRFDVSCPNHEVKEIMWGVADKYLDSIGFRRPYRWSDRCRS